MSTDAIQPEAQAAAAATTTQEAPAVDTDLLQQILNESRSEILKASKIRDDAAAEQKSYQLDLVSQLVEDVMKGAVTVSADTEAMLNARIAEIDALLTDQLNAIMHDEAFQKLEASWRGLHYLVDKSETSTTLQIRVIHATKKELLRDMEKAKEFDQSALFKKIYEEEYGVFGGEPFGALIGDYEFGKHPQDLALLKRISQVAAAAHAPFISAADPNLFGFESFEDLSNVRDLAEIFRTRDYDKWKAFRESDDSRYVGLALPHILMRLPYGPNTVPVEAFQFDEKVDGTDVTKYLWGNAAYAMGARLTEAFALYGWCASIRGVENGGLVQDLPLHSFLNARGEIENPPLPARIGLGFAIDEGGELQPLDQRVDAPRRVGPAHTIELRVQHEVLASGRDLLEPAFLSDIADMLADLGRLGFKIEAGDGGAPAGRNQ